MLKVKNGDIIKMINPIGYMKLLNEKFTVTKVENGLINFVHPRYGEGVMSLDGSEKFFINVTPKEWTEWKPCVNDYYQYKTNGKRIIVKHFSGIKAKSSCLEGDNFDLAFGINLCVKRIAVKIAQSKVDKIIQEKYPL